jgi:RHS repeat-associated protein
MRVARLLILTAQFITFLALFTDGARAQVDPNIEQGIKPYGSYHGGGIDNVGLTNGNLFVKIPLYSLPQRGGKLKLGFSLVYNNKGFGIFTGGTCPPPQLGSCHLQYVARRVGPLNPGLSGVFLANDQSIRVVSNSVNAGAIEFPDGCYANNGVWVQPCNVNVTEYFAITGDGYVHQLADTGNGYYETIDASGIRYYLSSGLIVDSDGVQYPANTTEDPNGNKVTLSANTITDTLGRSIPNAGTAVSTTLCPSLGYTFQPLVSASQFLYPGPNGTNVAYTFCYATVNYNTHFWGFADSPPGCQAKYCFYDSSGSITALQSVVLPNSTYWAFSYDSSDPNNSSAFGYGDLLKITFPTGGTISYTYITEGNCTLGESITAPSSRAVASRTVDAADGTGPHTWNYLYGADTLGNPLSTTVTNPPVGGATTGDDTYHVFTAFGGNACQAYETETDFYLGSHTSGTLLKKLTTDYLSQANPFMTQGGSSIVPIRVTTIWPNAKTSKVETDYDLGFTFRDPLYGNISVAVNTTYPAAFGRPVASREYDYGTNAAGPLLRQTATTYAWQTNSNYLNTSLLNLATSTITKNASGFKCAETDYAYDDVARLFTPSPAITTQHVAAPGAVRGNLSSVTRKLTSTPCQSTGTWTSITSYVNAYDTGTTYQMIDPLAHPTTYVYSTTFVGAYPTAVTNALSYSTNYNYDFNTGLHTSTTDPNLLQTTFGYDSMFRLSQINRPDGGQDTITHQEATAPFTATLTTKINPSQNKAQTNVFDGFGRVTQSQLTSAPGVSILVDTTYDALGRMHTVSNPHGSGSAPTDGTTTYMYDSINRTCVVVPPDGTAVSGSTCPATQPANDVFTTYSGNTTTVKDQAGKSRKSVSDGLGRLTQVFEDPAVLNYETDYTYDALDNLLTVNQKGNDPNSANWRTRTFTYNSLSQLLTATNPESGTMTYTYTNDGTLATKIAPAPNQTGSATVTATYAYDQLHRLTQKSFSDTTPTVKYGYDAVAPAGCTLPTLTIGNGIGKRTGMCDAAGAEAWSYDITANVGWKITDARTTNSITKSTIVQNNLAGTAATLTYPSTRIITYAFDAAARPLSAIDSTGPINYATAAAYAPTGALSSLTNGASLVSTVYFNNRLQPCRISVKNTGTAPSACTDAVNIGNVLDFTYNFSVGTADNGNVTAITNNRDPLRSQSFTYDALNRLATAQTNATFATAPTKCWGEQFTYDPWANFLSITGSGSPYTGCTQEGLSTTATTKNQISGFCYDAAGNLLAQSAPPCPVPTYTYNAENQMTLTAGVTYTYDGDGKRVKKSNGKLYWYGMGSDPLDETDLTGVTTNAAFSEYIFFGGKRIARRDSTNAVNYYFADHLGTARTVTNSSGTPLDDSDFYPFGGERAVLSSSGNTYKFTGKERDSESGLDNFGARYDSSNLGRFISPDPENAGASLDAPQSWNAYSYVLNNPLKYVDPSGLDCIYVNEAGTGVDHVLTGGNPDCGKNTDGTEDNGYYVDGDVNQSSIAFTGGDNNTMFYSFKNENTPGGLIGHNCVGDCSGPDYTIDVNGNSIPGGFPTMSAFRTRLLPTSLSVPPIVQPFDLWNMTPEQRAEVQVCMSTGGELEQPEPGQTAAQVVGPNGKPAQYSGNNKPIIPNIKGAKRAGGITGVVGAFELIAGAQGCINDLAGK